MAGAVFDFDRLLSTSRLLIIMVSNRFVFPKNKVAFMRSFPFRVSVLIPFDTLVSSISSSVETSNSSGRLKVILKREAL